MMQVIRNSNSMVLTGLVTLLLFSLISCDKREVISSEDVRHRGSDQRVYITDSTQLFTGDVVRHYPRAGRYSRTPFLNGVTHGRYHYYDSSDQIVKTGVLVNGKREGEHYRYFEDRSYLVLHYQNGIDSGKQELYYSDGTLQGEGRFSQYQREGIFTRYFKTGEVQRVEKYSWGRIYQSMSYYKSGELELISEHDGGSKVHGKKTSYYKSGEIKEQGSYHWGRKNGEFTTWNKQGNLVSKELYNYDTQIESDEEITIDPFLHYLLTGDTL